VVEGGDEGGDFIPGELLDGDFGRVGVRSMSGVVGVAGIEQKCSGYATAYHVIN
jgi:hypothetical protein